MSSFGNAEKIEAEDKGSLGFVPPKSTRPRRKISHIPRISATAAVVDVVAVVVYIVRGEKKPEVAYSAAAIPTTYQIWMNNLEVSLKLILKSNANSFQREPAPHHHHSCAPSVLIRGYNSQNTRRHNGTLPFYDGENSSSPPLLFQGRISCDGTCSNIFRVAGLYSGPILYPNVKQTLWQMEMEKELPLANPIGLDREKVTRRRRRLGLCCSRLLPR